MGILNLEKKQMTYLTGFKLLVSILHKLIIFPLDSRATILNSNLP